MKSARINPTALWAAVATAGMTWGSSAALAYEDWTRNFRLGAWAGLNIGADFSLSGSVPLNGANAGQAGVGGINHVYDDGYVRVDDTGNAQGVTSYWGYQNASQLSGNTLTLRSSRSFTGTDAGGKDGGPQLGLDMAYGGLWYNWGSWGRLNLEFGFGLMPIDIKDSRSTPGVFNRTVHSFNTGGILMPQAPYSGGSSGLGPVIGDVATALPDETIPGQLNGVHQIDAWLYNLRLGPQYYQDIGKKWAFSVGAGFATGIVVGSYAFDETISIGGTTGARNIGKIGKTDFLFGAYANALIYYHVIPDADLYVGVQWMTLGDSRFADSNREASLKLGSGLQILMGINWPL